MQTISTHFEGRVQVSQLDRPDTLNAFNGMLIDELCDVFLQAADDERCKVLVLTGAGRAFSAGADLSEMGRATYQPRHGFDALLLSIIDFPKPLVVAVNGVAAGIGVTICGLADLVFMSNEARLRCPFSSVEACR